jgi:hypothetical protein
VTSPILRSNGMYVWRDQKFPSVTSVLGKALAKPALVWWSAKMAALEAIQMHNSDREWREWGWKEREQITTSHKKVSRFAADRGTSIHELADRLMRGQAVSPQIVPEALRPHFDGLKQFVQEQRPEPVLLEATVFQSSPFALPDGFGHCLPYAGTLDAVLIIGGRKFIVDYKTRDDVSKAKVWSENKLQLAAYRYAEFEGRLDGIERPMESVDGAAIISLFPGGYRFDEVKTGPDEFNAFAAARGLYEWLNNQEENKESQKSW